MLSEKAAKILSALYQNSPGRLSAKKLALMLDMSERSVATYLKEVISFCRENGISIESKRGVGTVLLKADQNEALLQSVIKPGQSEYSTAYRVGYILTLLLNNWTSYTIALLASDLYVARSTIASDLELAQKWLTFYQVSIQRKPGAGLYIDGAEKNVRRAIVEANRQFYHLAITDKQYTDKHYTDKQYTDKKCIGKHQTKKQDSDNKSISRQQTEKQYKVKQQAEEAYTEEAYTKEAYSEKEHTEKQQPHKAISPDYRLSDFHYERLSRQFKNSRLEEVITILLSCEHHLGTEFTEESFTMLLEYLLIQSKRSLNGYEVDLIEQDLLFWVNEERMQAANKIAEKLGEKNLLHISEEEVVYIYYLLISAEWHIPYKEERNPTGRLLILAEKILNYISRIFDVDTKTDEVCGEKLVTFLMPSLVRTRYGFHIQNPLLSEIKENYPAVFSVCYAAGRFYKELGQDYPTEDEISYLALLIGGAMIRIQTKIRAVLISAWETDIARLTADKLMEYVPNVEIVEVFSYKDRWKVHSYHPQIILSTVISYQDDQMECVYVSSRLKEEDIRRVSRALHKVYTHRQAYKEMPGFSSLLNPDLVFLDLQFLSREKLIAFAADILVKKGHVEESFYESAIQRERAGSTAMGKGIAMPHSTSSKVICPVVSFIRLAEPIDWGGEQVDIVFILALDFKEIKSTSTFFKGFYSLTSNDVLLTRIREAKSREEVIKILTEGSEGR